MLRTFYQIVTVHRKPVDEILIIGHHDWCWEHWFGIICWATKRNEDFPVLWQTLQLQSSGWMNLAVMRESLYRIWEWIVCGRWHTDWLAPRILRWLLYFQKICIPLHYSNKCWDVLLNTLCSQEGQNRQKIPDLIFLELRFSHILSSCLAVMAKPHVNSSQILLEVRFLDFRIILPWIHEYLFHT